ncbi:hypothetical protein E4T39_07617 [Aureobasidium subglaciale]|nr:hypothetical protein E4T39_07617 [Aureobasidium subglaciale]
MDLANIAAIGESSLALKAAAIAFIPITSVALWLRIYVRIFIVKGFGLDDMSLIVAHLMFLTFCGLAIHLIDLEHDPSTVAAVTSGHFQDAVEVIEKIYTNVVLFTNFYVFSIVFIKISLAFFYLRIIVERAAGKCLPDYTLLVMTYAFGALDALTDFIYAFLPIYVLWNSNMPIGMKFTAGFLLCIGSVSSICALIRVATLSNLKLDIEFFKQAVQTGLWSIIEPGLAIVATSLAACRPLWRKVFEEGSTGSFIKNTFMFRWSGSKRSGASSSSSRSTEKPVNKPNGLGFVERTEANKGFKKFNDDEYGVSTATVAVGDDRETLELQDLGRLEAQDDFQDGDESDTRITRSCLRGIRTRTFSTTSLLRKADNPIPANDPKTRDTPSPVSSTNATPLSSEGNMDKPLQESVQEGEERRVMQAPNRKGVWSRSQQAREKAMVGPRFEQMIMYDQPRPLAAIELIHKQPVNWVKERTVKCDGGGGPLGHPRIFINVDKPQICACTYCGLPYAKESNRKILEALPNPSYPLEPTGHEAEVPQGYQSNTGKPLEQR